MPGYDTGSSYLAPKVFYYISCFMYVFRVVLNAIENKITTPKNPHPVYLSKCVSSSLTVYHAL